MRMSYEECCGYFVGKFGQWNNTGAIEPYITNMDVNGIYEELRNDNAFKMAVCNYVSLVAEDRKAARVTDVIRVVGTLSPSTYPTL